MQAIRSLMACEKQMSTYGVACFSLATHYILKKNNDYYGKGQGFVL